MRLTRNNISDLTAFTQDLTVFLTELRGVKSYLRVIVLDLSQASNSGISATIWDSTVEGIERASWTGNINTINEKKIVAELRLPSSENIIMCNTILEGTDDKYRIFMLLEVDDRIKLLVREFLQNYIKRALSYFGDKGRVDMAEIIMRKKDILVAYIKLHIDLDIVNTLSSSQYEKRSLKGSIVYINNKNDALFKVRFAKSIPFGVDNIRLVRKVLEMSNEDLSILVYDREIVGLGTREGVSKKVTFAGSQKWSVNIGNRNHIRYAMGKYYFEQSMAATWADLPKNFMLKKYERSFNELVSLLCEIKSGALVIISSSAQEEVARLCNLERGFAIDPVNLLSTNTELITNLASVDGAVFLDKQLCCYGAGVILDGVAKRPGSTARGSRYNSARCYLDNRVDEDFVAMVFSEDESVDIISNKM